MHGVPYERALSWSDARRFAWYVALGEIKGGRFDWERLAWREPET